jgi:hypothetical protein
VTVLICLKHVRSLKLRPNWRIFMRHDWERFLKPGWEKSMPPGSSVAADMYHQLKAEKGRRWQVRAPEPTREEIAAEKAAYEEYRRKLAELRWMLAELKFEIKYQRLTRDLRMKAGFNPNQPRVPAGSPGAGEWTSEGGGAGRNDSRVLSDATSDNEWKPGAQYAAAKPQGDPPSDRPPEVTARETTNSSGAKQDREGGCPLERPNWRDFPSCEVTLRAPSRNTGLSSAAENSGRIASSGDRAGNVGLRRSPHRGASCSEGKGQELSRVVDRQPGEHREDLTVQALGDQPMVRNTEREPPFNGLSPREHLRGKDWSERYQMGLNVLSRFGVLKP